MQQKTLRLLLLGIFLAISYGQLHPSNWAILHNSPPDWSCGIMIALTNEHECNPGSTVGANMTLVITLAKRDGSATDVLGVTLSLWVRTFNVNQTSEFSLRGYLLDVPCDAGITIHPSMQYYSCSLKNLLPVLWPTLHATAENVFIGVHLAPSAIGDHGNASHVVLFERDEGCKPSSGYTPICVDWTHGHAAVNETQHNNSLLLSLRHNFVRPTPTAPIPIITPLPHLPVSTPYIVPVSPPQGGVTIPPYSVTLIEPSFLNAPHWIQIVGLIIGALSFLLSILGAVYWIYQCQRRGRLAIRFSGYDFSDNKVVDRDDYDSEEAIELKQLTPPSPKDPLPDNSIGEPTTIDKETYDINLDDGAGVLVPAAVVEIAHDESLWKGGHPRSHPISLEDMPDDDDDDNRRNRCQTM